MPSPLGEGQTVPPINRLNQGEIRPYTINAGVHRHIFLL